MASTPTATLMKFISTSPPNPINPPLPTASPELHHGRTPTHWKLSRDKLDLIIIGIKFFTKDMKTSASTSPHQHLHNRGVIVNKLSLEHHESLIIKTAPFLLYVETLICAFITSTRPDYCNLLQTPEPSQFKLIAEHVFHNNVHLLFHQISSLPHGSADLFY